MFPTCFCDTDTTAAVSELTPVELNSKVRIAACTSSTLVVATGLHSVTLRRRHTTSRKHR